MVNMIRKLYSKCSFNLKRTGKVGRCLFYLFISQGFFMLLFIARNGGLNYRYYTILKNDESIQNSSKPLLFQSNHIALNPNVVVGSETIFGGSVQESRKRDLYDVKELDELNVTYLYDWANCTEEFRLRFEHHCEELTSKWESQSATGSSKLDYCQCLPSTLVGLRKPRKTALTLTAVESSNKEVTPGGRWKPGGCRARQKVAIIIPFRDRQSHLNVLLANLHPMLQRQQIDYQIFVVEQADPTSIFNKGIIMNSGFLEINKGDVSQIGGSTTATTKLFATDTTTATANANANTITVANATVNANTAANEITTATSDPNVTFNNAAGSDANMIYHTHSNYDYNATDDATAISTDNATAISDENNTVNAKDNTITSSTFNVVSYTSNNVNSRTNRRLLFVPLNSSDGIATSDSSSMAGSTIKEYNEEYNATDNTTNGNADTTANNVNTDEAANYTFINATAANTSHIETSIASADTTTVETLKAERVSSSQFVSRPATDPPGSGSALSGVLRGPFDCYIFHDVDMLPEDDRNIYTCTNAPRHVGAYVDKYRYNLLYWRIFGGATAFTAKQFRESNGFSNEFYGWGGEDDDMRNRVESKNMSIVRFPRCVAQYSMIKHKIDKGNPYNSESDKAWDTRTDIYATNGLNSVNYTLLKVEARPLYTWMLISVPPPPKRSTTKNTSKR